MSQNEDIIAHIRDAASIILKIPTAWRLMMLVNRFGRLHSHPLAVLLLLAAAVQAQETRPIGKTREDQQRNAVLLQGYDYGKYTEALTGYTGQDRQRITVLEHRHAIRTRVGPRGNYKGAIAVLPDGTLVLATCRRENATSPLFAIHVYRSANQGLTWEEIGKTPLAGKEPSLTALPNGSLILTAQEMRDPKNINLARSSDGGRTWENSAFPGNDYPRNLIVERDGSVLMVRDEAPGPNWLPGNTQGSPHLRLERSQDGGKTWQRSKGFINWSEVNFGEISTLRLRDGRLLAALRRQIPGTKNEGFETTVITESSDDGRHWSKPRAMLNPAEVHAYLTELHDGRILATYSNYHLPWGVYAVISKDGGKTWDLDHPIELALSGGIYVGWPATVQLVDRSLLTCYCVEAYWREPPPSNVVTETVRWDLP
jgi:hypothetical protein